MPSVRRAPAGLVLVVLLFAGSAVAQGIAPSDSLQGYAIGAFNTFDSQEIVRGLPERGVQNLWVRQGAPSVLFAAIDMAERNSMANFPSAGPYRAAVSSSADAALAAGRGDFLLILLVPWTDRFGEEASVVTLNVTGGLEQVELQGSAVDAVFHAAISLTDLPDAVAQEDGGTDEGTGEGEGEADEEPETVEPIVRGLASGELALGDYVDPQRGLVLIRYLEGGADGSPGEQTAERMCGEALATSQDAIRQALNELLERAEYDQMTCDALQCFGEGMEWQPSVYAIFVRDESGGLRLDSIQERSEALLGDEWFEAMEPWIAAHMAELRATPCAP